MQECTKLKTIRLYFISQVGLAACQIARAYGLRVLGTAGTEEGQNIVLQNGAHEVFNHREVNYIDAIKVRLFYSYIRGNLSLGRLPYFFKVLLIKNAI